jgi:hypothetical protein
VVRMQFFCDSKPSCADDSLVSLPLPVEYDTRASIKPSDDHDGTSNFRMLKSSLCRRDTNKI